MSSWAGVARMAESLSHLLVFNFGPGDHSYGQPKDAPPYEPLAIIDALASHCHELIQLTLIGEDYYREGDPRNPVRPPAVEGAWYEGLSDEAFSTFGLWKMATKYPTEAALTEAVEEIDRSLLKLGHGCRRLEHLTVSLLDYDLRSTVQPIPACLLVSTPSTAVARLLPAAEIFPQLRHFCCRDVCVQDRTVALLIDFAPKLQTLVVGTSHGRMMNIDLLTGDAIRAIAEVTALRSEASGQRACIQMVDVTGWNLDEDDLHPEHVPPFVYERSILGSTHQWGPLKQVASDARVMVDADERERRPRIWDDGTCCCDDRGFTPFPAP